MPWLHRYVGNPVLTGVLNLFFRTGVRDAHCGMRALRRDVLPRLALRTTGMEFASEMVIRAAKEKLDIRQVEIEYHPRGGESKLSTWRDGWRHLRFLLLHSPTHLFIIPGAVLALIGVLVIATSLAQVHILGRTWQIHSMIGGSLFAIVGIQTVALGVCARSYAVFYMGDRWRLIDRLDGRLRLEHGLLGGFLLAGLGIGLLAYVFAVWANRGFGSLGEERVADLAATLIVIGMQVVFSSCLLSILALRRDRD
jgi:hypothetical protein